jgi:hypothetical protein
LPAGQIEVYGDIDQRKSILASPAQTIKNEGRGPQANVV